MSNPWVVFVVTFGLIAVSAFFVAVEFALLAARRHRLEEAAERSTPARYALRSTRELSVLLAGSQLGITACTLALGATTKPAVHYWLTPVIHAWGAPLWVADAAGFVLALIVVTFLHLVIGEMAPKSWAIAHPERAATLLAIPMRAFMTVTRPLLVGLNHAANWCLRPRRCHTRRRPRQRPGSRRPAPPCRTLSDGRNTRPTPLPEPDQRAGARTAHRWRYRVAHCGIERGAGGGARGGHSGPIAGDSSPTDTRVW